MKTTSIKTIADIDKYIKDNPKIDKWGRGYYMSRCNALTELFGEDYATIVLNEMALQQCCPNPKGIKV